jgi:Transglutaminase-like superfamily
MTMPPRKPVLMEETKEISALFTLIDDPDEEVYSTVSNKIIDYGKSIIPNLEHLWETSPNIALQERIELLIHRLHFTDLTVEFNEWINQDNQDLLTGALLVGKFQYPEMNIAGVLHEIEKLRRNIWLELNSYLTPLEQANVISSILFKYFHLKGVEMAYTNPDDYFLNKVVECKRGNALSLGILYQIMCSMLDINARIINIPRQTVIAFFHSDFEPGDFSTSPREMIHFYVDGCTGNAYSDKEIEMYFKKIAVPPTTSFFKPKSNKRVLKHLLEETSKCFNTVDSQHKQIELISLSNLLD